MSKDETDAGSLQIPDKPLDGSSRPQGSSVSQPGQVRSPLVESPTGRDRYASVVDDDDDEEDDVESAIKTMPPRPRRLSGYETTDGGMDLESDTIGGSARSNIDIKRAD